MPGADQGGQIVRRHETGSTDERGDLSGLQAKWLAAGRFDWVIALGIVAVTLPTGLFLYDKIPAEKSPLGWIGILAATTRFVGIA
jgi:hypothetical protein